jgi:hypothetical protein
LESLFYQRFFSYIRNSLFIHGIFNAFVLNAQYFFSGAYYFELLRPPLVPLLLGAVRIFSWKLAPYIFIIISSFLLMHSTLLLAKKFNYNKVLFYALSTNAYVLLIGVVNGSELLFLALLQFGIYAMLSQEITSGLFFALAALTRYAGLIFAPLILFQKNIKKVFLSIIIYCVAIGPWLLYNKYTTGNFFTSIADQYANNILLRQQISSKGYPFLLDFLIFGNYLLPFLIIGILLLIYGISKELNIKKISLHNMKNLFFKYKIDFFMLIIFFILYYQYVTTPLRATRYLFPAILPVAFFAYKGITKTLEYFSIKNKIYLVATIIIVISVLSAFTIQFYSNNNEELTSINVLKILEELELDNCELMSNIWVGLNAKGLFSQPAPRASQMNSSIQEGFIIALLKYGDEPEYVSNQSFLEKFPIIFDSEQYIIIGSSCKKPTKFNLTYLEQTKIYIENAHNYSINTNPCFVMFSKHKLLEQSCNFINGNGFKSDENRAIG